MAAAAAWGARVVRFATAAIGRLRAQMRARRRPAKARLASFLFSLGLEGSEPLNPKMEATMMIGARRRLNSEMLLLTDCRRYYLSNSKHGATKTAHPTRLDLLLGSRVGNGLYVRPGRRVHQYIADKLTKC
ncbi:hypothetical protein ZWY2020_017022 [Hordeum vulgare]|nr:hypothetical protein ZWY2020_017022 [Hordeum vulgare]